MKGTKVMCGIVGFITNKKDKLNILKSMMQTIEHRGPDGFGTFIDEYIALGHNRLAIIDIKDGIQPQYNEDKSLAIIFNGEIYNYQELMRILKSKGHKFATKSDTEVIIHAYEEWKYDTPKHLRGMFAFAIWDKYNKELFLARDPSGIKPLYYAKFNNTFMFASEIKALKAHPDFTCNFNDQLLASYLCFGFNASDETMFKRVYNLEPGTYLTYQNNNITKKRYFHFEFTNKSCSLTDIQDAIKDSINHHLISDIEVGSFLSSGIDSSYIVSLADIKKNYTVGYENNNFSEIKYAQELSTMLNQTNKDKIITKEEYLKALPKVIKALDEPLADPSAIAMYFCAEIASPELKVVLSGEGADELFAGYLTYMDEITLSWYMKIPFLFRNIASKIASIFPDMKGINFIYRRGRKLEDEYIGINRICRDKEACNIVKSKRQTKPQDITHKYYEQYSNCTNLQKRQMIDFNLILAKDFLPAIDRNCMLFGLEARTPFLDIEVFKVASSLLDTDKINKNTTKYILREAAKSAIPNGAYKKKKLGFPVPLKEWMKEDDYYQEILSKFSSPTADKFFNQKKIIRLLKSYKNDKYHNYKFLWSIYVFIIWYDLYF
ncbi:MAG: asparagine synthase (glutamine-hydrolyzing) [Bacilli bacterium]|nr:asparagine synthase (glutamine-hydrolyzing) [Bacilli bacterium]